MHARRRGRRRRSTSYGRALKNHDFGAAYDLMSSGFRGKVSREDYVRMMRDNPREVDETAERLRGKHGSLEVSAEFEYGLGDQMRLVQEGGRWKIATNPLGVLRSVDAEGGAALVHPRVPARALGHDAAVRAQAVPREDGRGEDEGAVHRPRARSRWRR